MLPVCLKYGSDLKIIIKRLINFTGYSSWLTHESPGGKLNWLSDIKLFSVINPKDLIGFSQ